MCQVNRSIEDRLTCSVRQATLHRAHPEANAKIRSARRKKRSMHFETRCVHVGVDKDSAYKSCITPIYPTSTFAWDDLETNRGFDYTRSGNPTRKALEENIASLEGGIDCKATSTGMSAITAAMHLFQPGDHIIAGHDIYGGTYRLFADVYAKWGFKFSFVNMGDPENVRKAITPATKGIWIETPSNPLLNLVDLAAVSKIARDAGLITLADNTFLSPYLQRPFEHGVDIVMHSTTKYLNGHSDVVGGCVVTRHQSQAEPWLTSSTRWAWPVRRLTRGWSCAALRHSARGCKHTNGGRRQWPRCSKDIRPSSGCIIRGGPAIPTTNWRGGSRKGSEAWLVSTSAAAVPKPNDFFTGRNSSSSRSRWEGSNRWWRFL